MSNGTDDEIIYIVVSDENTISSIAVGDQGPPGPPGTSARAEAGDNLNPFMAVVLLGGVLVPCDPTDLSHVGKVVGIVTHSALPGDMVEVTTVGIISGGVFTAGARYYVGLNGYIRTDPIAPGALWGQSVGNALSDATDFIVELGQPVILA